MNCQVCHEALIPGAHFCGLCGATIATPIARKEPIALVRVKNKRTAGGLASGEVSATGTHNYNGHRFSNGHETHNGRSDHRSNGEPILLRRKKSPSNLQSPNGQGRRIRFPQTVEITERSAHNFFADLSHNVRHGGIFVSTHTTAHVGEFVDVEFTLPEMEEPYIAPCKVAWVRDYDPNARDTAPGIGLRFLELQPQIEQSIQHFIQHREPILFED